MKAEFWTCEKNAERFSDTDLDEAVESFLDGTDLKDETITAYGYAPMKLPENPVDTDYLLEYVLEALDEEFGDPEEPTEPNDAMQEAAEKFAKAIAKNYRVFACEIVETREIDVAAWIKEHRPDWLAERGSDE